MCKVRLLNLGFSIINFILYFLFIYFIPDLI